MQVIDNPTVKEVPYVQTVVRVEERIVEIPVDKEVIREYVQEVVVDKVHTWSFIACVCVCVCT
jgi:hypothetical protein